MLNTKHFPPLPLWIEVEEEEEEEEEERHHNITSVFPCERSAWPRRGDYINSVSQFSRNNFQSENIYTWRRAQARDRGPVAILLQIFF